GVRTLSLDDVELGRLATEHLLALGHTEIAHIGGDALEMDFHLPTNRRHGYELAMRAAGLQPEDRHFHAADFTMESGYRAA
ncbi:LacI family transcriptional regulator, partial [Schumannella luteola]